MKMNIVHRGNQAGDESQVRCDTNIGRLAIGVLACLFLGASACGSADPCASAPGDGNKIVQHTDPVYELMVNGSVEKADEIRNGVWDLPRFEPVEYDEPRWDVDPYQEQYWRFIYYSLRHTKHLIAAYEETGETAYYEELRSVAMSFVDANADDSKPARDPHTTAFLSLMLTHIAQELDSEDLIEDDSMQEIQSTVWQVNCRLMQPEYFEKDNNHGITQATALLFSGVVFGNKTWEDVGKDRILEVMRINVDEDGAQIEQSPFYHFYSLGFFWQIYDWARDAGVDLPNEFVERVDSMVNFGQWFIKPDGTLPLMGATKLVNLRKTARNPIYDEIAEQYPTFRWFRTGGESGEPPETLSKTFRNAGYGIVRFHETADTHLVFDSGPYRTTHSDLDALSLVWTPLNRDVLVDSGLYSLESGPLVRYFRSTAAHNTIVVGDKSQRDGNARLRQHHEGDQWAYFSGVHELYDGVRHVRAVIALGPETMAVIDRVEGAETTVRQAWNLAPSLSVGVSANGAELTSDEWEETVDVTWIGGEFDRSVKGQLGPPDGWYSVDYEKKVPASTFYVRHLQRSGEPLVTGFAIGDATIEADYLESNVVELRATGSNGQSYRARITNLGRAGESVEVVTNPSSGGAQ